MQVTKTSESEMTDKGRLLYCLQTFSLPRQIVKFYEEQNCPYLELSDLNHSPLCEVVVTPNKMFRKKFY